MRMASVGLGERDIIRRFSRRFSQSRPRLPLGFDDDVSAYPMSRKKWLILKTDTLVGSTDIPPGMSLEQASRKAVVATVSDFAAKGVQPAGLMISLALPAPVKPDMVTELVEGIYKATREYRCEVVGGDTGESRDLMIDCIGFGFAVPNRILRRDRARPGDIIAVTGNFGKTTAGLRILLSKNKSLARKFSGLIDSVLYPVARLETGLRLAKSGMVTSSIDSSDGLAWSLHEIARLSNVGMVLEKIPLAAEAQAYAKQRGLIAEELALYGGEEYELVLTVKKEGFASLKRMVPSLIRVGTVQRGRSIMVSLNGERGRRIEPRGWEHMVSKD
jgi:thiamine-monophosphate kinase